MSKPWKPGRQTVELQPSRIRREPARVQQTLVRPRRSNEQEVWFGVAGVVVTGAALAALLIAVAVLTIFRNAEPAKISTFPQCYGAGGSDCVVDGDTLRIEGERVGIAGIEAPRIQGAACPAERKRGVEAALRLANILGSGEVAIGPPIRDAYGRQVRAVAVAGQDIAQRMIAHGAARRPEGQRQSWC